MIQSMLEYQVSCLFLPKGILEKICCGIKCKPIIVFPGQALWMRLFALHSQKVFTSGSEYWYDLVQIVYLPKMLKPRQCSHMEKELPNIPCVQLDTYAHPRYNLLKYDWPCCGFHLNKKKLVIFGHFLITCKLCQLFSILDRIFSFIGKMFQYRNYIVGIFKVLCLPGEWDGRSFAAPLTPNQHRFMVYLRFTKWYCSKWRMISLSWKAQRCEYQWDL